MAPKISIVIPVYNSAKYLRECLDSICSQSFADWEIVAVDDGSSDESPKILDEYAARDDRVRVTHKVNGGVSAARNDGLDAAVGDYVLFVDSDDWLCENALQTYWDEVLRTDADIVIADHLSFWEDGRKKRFKFFSQNFVTDDRNVIDKLQLAMLYVGHSPFYSPDSGYLFSAIWTKLFRRKMLVENAVRFPRSISLFEDGMVGLYALQFANRVSYQQKPVYCYRVLKTSLCHSSCFSSLPVYEAISNEIVSFIGRFEKTDDFNAAYEARFVYYVKKQVGQIFSCNESFLKKYFAIRKLMKEPFYQKFLIRIPKLHLVRKERLFGKLAYRKFYLAIAILFTVRKK